ncbi:hypothetical protein DSOL_1492 [Desulfosporosinus metallidurans]|uniref:Uncharacterized protein n=1 Tax=Desulfosporosinus metallidurans TaxID=1888891 RepID=A0A1Q8QZL3_9FIRM|nr:hypothetical protein DSOL_1492 [Desulfosporosinus metallidurans]
MREICTPGSVGVGSPKVTLLPGAEGEIPLAYLPPPGSKAKFMAL